MTGVTALWLPILLSVIAIFIVSSVIHMLLPWHKGDYLRLPNEDAVMDALRPLAIAPGDYMIPNASSMADMKSPEFSAKMDRGPVMIATVRPNGMPTMTRSLVLWFLYLLVVTVGCAYIAGRTLPPSAGHRMVFRPVMMGAFLGYAAALWQMTIWYHRSMATTIRSTVDSVIYAGITALLFAYLWPRG